VAGHKPQEVLGQDGFEFLHPDDVSRMIEVFSHLLENPGSTTFVEVRVRAADGSWLDAEAVAQNLLDDNLVQGIVVNFRDVTERKRVEQEKRTIEEQLQLAGRLAAVGELAAGVAHELNNPLTAVQAFAQFLSQRDNLDDSIKGDVETIYREAQRATRITGNLLSFARRNKPEQSLISLNDVVERSLELHAYRMRVNGIEVVKDIDEHLPAAMADFHQMQQVFVNIINNAEQAMTEAHGAGTLVVRTGVAGNMIEVSFIDDGPGILDEDLKRVFDPFFTTKEVGRGTGLGLSICYGIVESHGGYLRAESDLGKGAAFIVELPIASDDAGDVTRDDETREARA
jgi:PAS domain S-box-containing protein